MNIKKYLILPLACCGLAAPVVAGAFVNSNVKNAVADEEMTKGEAFNAIKGKTYYLPSSEYKFIVSGEDEDNGTVTIFNFDDEQMLTNNVSVLRFSCDETLRFFTLGGQNFDFSLDCKTVIISTSAGTYNGTYGVLIEHPQETFCTEDGHKTYYECLDVFYEDNAFETEIGDSTALATWKSEGNGYIAPSGHDAEPEFIGGTMSDCTHDGNYGYYHCTKCDKYFSDLYLEYEIVDLEEWKAGDGKMAASHRVELIEGQEAKCHKPGWRDYYKCLFCDKCFENEECTVEIENLEAWKIGKGKIIVPHIAQKINGVPATCNTAGYKDSYKCSFCEHFFEDEECTVEIENLEAWKTGKGKITVPHTAHKINGVPATCTTAGYKDSYKCSVCEYFFEDEACTILIGDDTPWFEWCVDGGKLDLLEHHGVIQDGKAATTAEAGWKEYYKCSECGKYFEEIGCINEITDLEAWKIGNGKIDKLSEPQPEPQPEPPVNPTPEEPKEGLSGGAIAGIAVGSVVGVSLISYGTLLGVFIKTKKAPKFLIKSFEAIIKLFKK